MRPQMIQGDREILGSLIVDFECDLRDTIAADSHCAVLESQHTQHIADAAEGLGAEPVAAAQQAARCPLCGLAGVRC